MPLQFLGNPPLASDQQPRPFSPAVRAGDFVYVSGQVPADDKGEIVQGGIEIQTRQVMANLSKALALAGCRGQGMGSPVLHGGYQQTIAGVEH